MVKDGILLVANYSNKTGYAWGNIFNLFSAIANYFLREGYDIHISFAQIDPPVDQFDQTCNITYHEYDPKNKSIINTKRLIDIITTQNIRYVYLTDQAPFDIRYMLLRVAGVQRIVVHQRISVADPNPATYQGGIKGFVKSLLGRLDLISADKIFAVSDFVKRRLLLKNRIPARRVEKILNGINLDRFQPYSAVNPDHVSDTVTIFVCGRATEYKGIQVLIEAVKLLDRNSSPNFVIRYAGDGPDMHTFKNLVSKYGLQSHFIFLGEINGTADEVCHADIVIVPSIWGDACPSSVSEALASGKALIATAVGGVPEIIGQDDNAILVAPNDPKELSLALYRLLRSPTLRDQMGVNARHRAENALDEKKYHSIVISHLHKEFKD